jgi:hypothetical protein
MSKAIFAGLFVPLTGSSAFLVDPLNHLQFLGHLDIKSRVKRQKHKFYFSCTQTEQSRFCHENGQAMMHNTMQR